MTYERFQRFLQSPDLLSTVPYEELKTLTLTYPYAANLRLLLWLKSSQENRPDEERNRATAAAYSLDRTRLFVLTQETIAPLPAMELDVLDLKPLSKLNIAEPSVETAPAKEKSLELPALPPTETPPSEESLPPSETPRKETTDTDNEAFSPVTEELPLVQASSAKAAKDEAFPSSKEATIPPEETPTERHTEEHFLSFAEWANHFTLVPISRPIPPSAPSAVPPTNPETAANVAQQLAQKSVSENPAVISETLARLYAQQGYRDRAIEMYRRLMALYPEKSAFFAAQIEALTKHT
mgnify:CR=1 FL=1